MKRKFILLFSLLFFVLTAISMTACKNGNEGEREEMVKVWSALSTEKYMQDAVPEAYPEAKLNFSGMKGETQSAQLMITANQYIKGFDLITDDLKSEDGQNVISNENIKVYAEHYVEIYDPYVNTWKGGQYMSDAGFYPDALIPIEKYRVKRQDRINKGNNQGIWVDVEIPENTAAGNYTGKFTLIIGAEKKEYEIPVSVKVYNLTIPEEIHAKSLFLIWYDELSQGEGDNYDGNTDRVYYDYLLSKRLTAGFFIPEHTAGVDEFLANAIRASGDPKITCYCVPINYLGFSKTKLSTIAPSSPSEIEVAENIKALYNGFQKFFRKALNVNLEYRMNNPESKLDIFKKMLFYFEDEPTIGYRTQGLRVFNEQLQKAKVSVQQEYAAQLSEHSDLSESFMAVSDITPTNYVNENLFVSSKNGDEEYVPDYKKSDGVTLWCPEQFNWRSGGFRETVAQRMAYGEKFWWYTCVMNSPELSYYVESLPIGMRLASWQQYEFDIEGTLYWDVVHWSGIEAKGSSPYDDVQYGAYGGGEGLLMYPGITYGQKTPISSIRLEQLRLGSQDYELMWMLDEYLKPYNQTHSINLRAKEIVAKMGTNLYNYATVYTEEEREGNCYQEFESNRIDLLGILEMFAGDKADDAIIKINSILTK